MRPLAIAEDGMGEELLPGGDFKLRPDATVGEGLLVRHRKCKGPEPALGAG